MGGGNDITRIFGILCIYEYMGYSETINSLCPFHVY